MDRSLYENHLAVLKSELITALGCTEPIAIALAGARARQLLGTMPETATVYCSGNIVKNVMGVTVPNSGGLRGINVAALLGIIGGDADLDLDVLSTITDEHREKLKEMLALGVCIPKLREDVENLYIRVELAAGGHSSIVEIRDTHKNVTYMEKDGVAIPVHAEKEEKQAAPAGDKSLITVDNAIEFAEQVELDDVRPILERQISCNMAICEEGLKNPYGAEVGRTLMKCSDQNDVGHLARAYAAAGSDARMNGCALPVVINSGSGNQGITVSVPVIVYARHYGLGEEKLLRALTAANLIALHQKYYIGSLSAYCGVVSAACGAACGISMLMGYPREVINSTITNTIATVGGMVCDGAKSSCAAKISTALQTALLGLEMGINGSTFRPGEGMVTDDVEETISNIGRMGREGMKATDKEILNIMLGN